jgi:hypothetical protein
MEDAGYRKLAMCVIARAVVDVKPPKSESPTGGSLDRGETYHMQTARTFLSTRDHPMLNFWCQWVDLDPSQVCRAYAAGTLLSPYRSATTQPYRRR